MRFAYADPPYLGCGAKFYAKHHPEAAVWDDLQTHRDLIDRLTDEYPDGWALSCHTPSLRVLWPMCPEDTRVGAWVKPFHVMKKGVRPSYGWEPLLFRGGRNEGHPPPEKGGPATTPRDFVAANVTLWRDLPGAKPDVFNRWVLDILGFIPGEDTLDDLFPGTGGMARAMQMPSLYVNAGEAS